MGRHAREVVLPAEVPRLKRAAVALLAASAPFAVDGLAVADRVPLFWMSWALCAATAVIGAVGVLVRPLRPGYRRFAFLGSMPISLVLIVALVVVTFATDEAQSGGYLRYVVQVVITAGAAWSTYVLWPTVEVSAS
jgi:hypothetical protein